MRTYSLGTESQGTGTLTPLISCRIRVRRYQEGLLCKGYTLLISVVEDEHYETHKPLERYTEPHCLLRPIVPLFHNTQKSAVYQIVGQSFYSSYTLLQSYAIVRNFSLVKPSRSEREKRLTYLLTRRIVCDMRMKCRLLLIHSYLYSHLFSSFFFFTGFICQFRVYTDAFFS